MRKCVRCETEMLENCTMQANAMFSGSGFQIEHTPNPHDFSKRMQTKVAVCPNCGEVSLYVEDFKK